MKIIDSHMHLVEVIAGIGSQGELRSIGNGKAQYASGQVIKVFPNGYDQKITPEDLLKVMDDHNVEKAVLLQGNYLGFQNLYTYECVKKYPNRFVGAATYDPFSRNKQKIINHLFDELGFKIIKMEVSNGSGLMCNHDTVDLDGPLMHEVYSMANSRNLIFTIDIGRPRNDCWQVDNLVNAIKKYPNMTFVICHLLAPQLGDDQLLEESLSKLRLPNVYFDLASLSNNVKPEEYPFPTAIKYIQKAISIVGSDRLLWGSDFPSACCKTSYEKQINYLLNSDFISNGDKQKIFYDNANKVYFNK